MRNFKQWLVAGALAVALAMSVGALAFSAIQAQNSTPVPTGVLPVRLKATNLGAGVETSALIGDYCKSATYSNAAGTPVPNILPTPTVTYLTLECQDDTGANPPSRSVRQWRLPIDPMQEAEDLTAAAIKAVLTGADGVESANVVNGSLTGEDIHDGSLGENDYARGSVTGNTVRDGSLTGQDYGHLTVDSEHIATEAITASKLAPGAVTADKFADDRGDTLLIRSFTGCYDFLYPLEVTHGTQSTDWGPMFLKDANQDTAGCAVYRNAANAAAWSEPVYPISSTETIIESLSNGLNNQGARFTLPPGLYRLDLTVRFRSVQHTNGPLDDLETRTMTVKTALCNGGNAWARTEQSATVTAQTNPPTVSTSVDDLLIETALSNRTFCLHLSLDYVLTHTLGKVQVASVEGRLWKKG